MISPMLLYIEIFFLGLIIGSFLNVVILRLNTGMTLSGRSACFSCAKTLRWYELVPVISYVVLGGRCGACRSRISIQYPLVELITGILFVLIAFRLEMLEIVAPLPFLLFASIFSLLLAIAVYDWRHKIIPDTLVGLFVILSFVAMLLRSMPMVSITDSLLALVSGPLLALPFFLISGLSRGRLMGWGDGTLTIGIGYLLGLSLGLSAIVFGVWIAAIVSLLLLAISQLRTIHFLGLAGRGANVTMKSEIPFAPFLALATFLVWVSHISVLSLSLNLFF